MSNSIFVETRFWLMVIVSVVLPVMIYSVLSLKRAISRTTVLLLGFTLLAIAGLDVYFLQSLARMAKATLSVTDDTIFVSEVSFALYVLPVMFGGVGVNIISYILVSHLAAAERRFAEERVDG
jgi:hypothetical protein